MLKKIKIKNYKAFKQDTTLEIRPLTILIGRNSSGKSSLCKLIDAIGEALRVEVDGFLPIQTERHRLGDMYEDLFYKRMTSDLQMEMTFDDDMRIKVNFLMQDGVFCPISYAAQKGKEIQTKKFSSKEESLRAGFVGLYYPELCEDIGISHKDVKFNVDYIGPIRCPAKRRIERANIKQRSNYVGEDGSNAYEMLLRSHLKDGDLLNRVSEWCKDNMEGQKMSISEQAPGLGVFSLFVERREAHVNIADVGEGIAQVLPVIVQSFVSNSDITIIEQPSLHLNSVAHALVACRLAESSMTLGKKYLIETHSDTFLTGIRKMAVERKIRREDVVIYYVHHDGDCASLEKIEIDENFDYTWWPEGLFEDDFRLQNEIIRLIG